MKFFLPDHTKNIGINLRLGKKRKILIIFDITFNRDDNKYIINSIIKSVKIGRSR